MIRLTQLINGTGTVRDEFMCRALPPHEVPRSLLAFTQTRKPVVFWNITRKCNLSCTHCYIDAISGGNGAPPGNELSLAEAHAFIADLAEIKIPLLMFTGGEPLVRPDFWDLAGYAKECGITTAISSNGTLITKEIAGKIKDCGIEYAGISLDGANAGTHDAFRNKPGCFDKTVQGLKNCNDAGIKTGVRITVTRDNAAEVAPLIDLARDLGVPRFCVYWLVPSGRGTALYDRQVPLQEAGHVFDLLYRKAHELNDGKMEILTVDAPQDGISLLNKLRENGSAGFDDAKTLLTRTGDSCSAGDRVANVNPSGNVYPCQFLQKEAFLIGNVREQKFSAIWNDSKNPVLEEFRGKKERVQGACAGCTHRDLCGGGCRARAYGNCGNIWAEDHFCPFGTPG